MLTEITRYYVGNYAGTKSALRLMVRDVDGDVHHVKIVGKPNPTAMQITAFKAEIEPILMAMKAKTVAEPVGEKVGP